SMSGMTSQPPLNGVVAALRHTERDTGLDQRALDDISRYWAQVRELYYPFEEGMNAPEPAVYRHEMPGGQYTNLRQQSKKLGAAPPPADFAAVTQKTRDTLNREPRDGEVLTSILYPEVYREYLAHWTQYGDTSTIPTVNFFYGLQTGEEIAVEIEQGKTLIVRYLTTGDVRDDGTRTVFFELNGQPR